MKVEFQPGAEADANAAQQWYAERSAIAARKERITSPRDVIRSLSCFLHNPSTIRL